MAKQTPKEKHEASKVRAATACEWCGARFVPVRHQRFCGALCRVAAWQAAHPRVKTNG